MQTSANARSVLIPEETAIRTHFLHTDLADAYAIDLPAGASTDPETLARFLFEESQAPWVVALMRVRDAVMAPFGVKTTGDMQSISPGRIGIFRMYAKHSNEIVLGEDDRHLDFRLSIMIRNGDTGDRDRKLFLSTVVCCHNRLGRGYLAAIKPFHKLIVRTSLNRAAKSGWPNAGNTISAQS